MKRSHLRVDDIGQDYESYTDRNIVERNKYCKDIIDDFSLFVL
jgi:hypothetical protein